MKIKNSSKLTMLLATILVAGTSNAKQIKVKVQNNTSYPILFAIVCANQASDFSWMPYWTSEVKKVDSKQFKSINIETDYKFCNLKVRVVKDDKGHQATREDNTLFKTIQIVKNTKYGKKLEYYISEYQEPIPTEPIEVSSETE